MTIEGPLERLLDGITAVRTEGVGIDGVVLGKHLSRAKFERSLPLGPAVSDIMFIFDLRAQPQVAWWDDWRQYALGDIHQRPDLATLVRIGHRPGFAACIVDHVDVNGESLPVCPRSTLKRVVERLSSHGLSARAAMEIEGMVFVESYDEARAKNYRELTPLGIPQALGYLTHDAYRMHTFMDEVVRRLDGMGIAWDAWVAEGAPGQFEINFPAADPVSAADAAARARAVCKETAIDPGHSVTFMAKPTEGYGSGGHIHHSLTRDGSPAFYDASAPECRSQLMRHWIGGLMATMPAAHSFLTPTINSYRRMVDFQAAPNVVSWAEENKSTALRVVSRSEGLARVEHRVGAADLNPYLALAAILAGGIVGIEQAIEPPPEMRIIAWGLPETFPHLPKSISASADALEADKALVDVIGSVMCSHWVNTRRWEWMNFHTTGGDAEATSVTDWELQSYFELI
jgi:glutamine synthetase